jgi:hypothetical protein
MKSTVVALFTTPEEVDRLLAALRRAGVREMNSQTIENLAQDGPDMPDAKLASEAGWSEQPAPRYTETELLGELGLTDDEIAFYSQGMELGGQLLAITVDERDAGRVEELMVEHGGEAFTGV